LDDVGVERKQLGLVAGVDRPDPDLHALHVRQDIAHVRSSRHQLVDLFALVKAAGGRQENYCRRLIHCLVARCTRARAGYDVPGDVLLAQGVG
jgi:hypothetical protein